MGARDGWYLVGPVIAMALLAAVAALLRWTLDRESRAPGPTPRDGCADGLDIFGDGRISDRFSDLFGDVADYGLLSPAALTDDLELAEDVRRLLAAAAIRSTFAVGRRGRVIVLVFAEEVEEARRLVGGSPAL